MKIGNMTMPLMRTWRTVSAPDAAFAFVPFTVQTDGARFRPAPGWNLLNHSALTRTKAYYVDRGTGSDAAAGTSWATALKTINAAAAKADVDVIYVRNGWFFRNECNTLGSRNIAIIGDGTAVFTPNQGNLAGAATLVGNHYEIPFGSYAYMSAVHDMLYLNAFGNGTRLTAKTSMAEVDAAPGSFWFNYLGGPTNTLYIRLSDDRAPDANVLYLDTGPLNITNDNRTLYFEGIKFYGGSQTFQNATSTGGLKVYGKNLTFLYGSVTIRGVHELILQNLVMHAGGDGVNYDARNTIVTKAIEINCLVKNESTGGTDQASTGHNACVIVRMNGRYGPCGGQVIADVSGCLSWLLGCWMHDSLSGIGHYQGGSGAKAWLDRCRTYGIGTYDLQNEVGATTYTRKFSAGKGVNQISGTLSTY